jgi:hypothetical protein
MTGNYIFDPTNAKIQELKILENCLKALMSLLGNLAADYGEAPWNVVHVAGPQAFREYARQHKNVVLPFIAIIVNSIRPSEESYNDQAMYNGFYMGQMNTNTANPTNVVMHAKPVAVDMQVMVYAQTFSDISYFSQRWLFRERDMQFALKTSNYNLPIKVKLNQELSVPELDFTDMGNLFVMQTQLTFYAYVGVLELQPQITKFNVTTEAYNPSTADATEINSITFGVGNANE